MSTREDFLTKRLAERSEQLHAARAHVEAMEQDRERLEKALLAIYEMSITGPDAAATMRGIAFEAIMDGKVGE